MTEKHPSPPSISPIGRRQFFGLSAATLVWVASGCSDDDSSPLPSSSAVTTSFSGEVAASELRPEDFGALETCLLLPAMAAGPFPTLEQLDRRDITEGYPGRPLRLGLRVIDEACTPLPDVVVEVWHADASGDYSSYDDSGTGKDEGAGTTFLRGSQRADENGIVEFATIYPGWYAGRAVHIHVRVHEGDELVLTSQLFIPDDRNLEVLESGPYAEFGPPDTTNETDGLGGDIANNGSMLEVTATGSGEQPEMTALLNLGVNVDRA